MTHPAETEGWHRHGTFIYLLHWTGDRKGKPVLVNKHSISVQPQQGGTNEEAEAIAERIFQMLSASPPVSPLPKER